MRALPTPLRVLSASSAILVACACGPEEGPRVASDDSLSAPLEDPVNKVTPLMTVEAVEPCLPFWTERLGFEVIATVPHGDAIGFAMLQRGGVELMYQARASVEDDLGPAARAAGHDGLVDALASSTTTLFIEVDALDPLLDALDGADVVVPRRETFYGMDEIFVRAPCGTLVGLAAQVEATGGSEGEAGSAGPPDAPPTGEG